MKRLSSFGELELNFGASLDPGKIIRVGFSAFGADDVVSADCGPTILEVLRVASSNCSFSSWIFKFLSFLRFALVKSKGLTTVPALLEVAEDLGLLPPLAKIVDEYYARHSLNCNLNKLSKRGVVHRNKFQNFLEETPRGGLQMKSG